MSVPHMSLLMKLVAFISLPCIAIVRHSATIVLDDKIEVFLQGTPLHVTAHLLADNQLVAVHRC